jgi:hypothetical protein
MAEEVVWVRWWMINGVLDDDWACLSTLISCTLRIGPASLAFGGERAPIAHGFTKPNVAFTCRYCWLASSLLCDSHAIVAVTSYGEDLASLNCWIYLFDFSLPCTILPASSSTTYTKSSTATAHIHRQLTSNAQPQRLIPSHHRTTNAQPHRQITSHHPR